MSEPSLISLLYSKRTKKEQTVINNFLLKNKIQFQPTHNVQKEYKAHVKITNLDQRRPSTEFPLPKSKSPARNENNLGIKAPKSSRRDSPLKQNKNFENNSNLNSNTNSMKNLLERRKSSVDSGAKTRQSSQETARLEKKNIDNQTMTKLMALVSMNNARMTHRQQEPEPLQTKLIETEKISSKKSSPKKILSQKSSPQKIPSQKSSPKKKEEESIMKQIETSIDEENIYPKKSSISPVLDDLLWKIDMKLQSEVSSPPSDSKLLNSEVHNEYELPAQQEILSLINLNSVENLEENNEERINKDNDHIQKIGSNRPTEETQDDLLFKIQQSLRMVSFERVEENEEDDDESLPHFGAQRTTTKSFLTTNRETDENIFINDHFQLESDFRNERNSPPKWSLPNPEEQKNISNSPSKMSVATNLELFDSFDVEEFQRLQSQFDDKVSEFENNSPRKPLSTQEELGLYQVPQQNFLKSSSINTITRVTETLQTQENEELFKCYSYLLSQAQKPQKDYIPIEEPSTQKSLKQKEILMTKSQKVFTNQKQTKTPEKARPKTPNRENKISQPSPKPTHSRKSSTQYPQQHQRNPSNLSKKTESGISTARSRSNLKSNQLNIKGTETNRSSVRSPTPPKSSRINTERKSRSPIDPALMNKNVNYDLMSSKNIVQHYQQLLKKLNNFPIHNTKR